MTLRILPSAPGTASTSWISSNTIRLVVPSRSNSAAGSSSRRSSTDSASTFGLRCSVAVKPPPPSDRPMFQAAQQVLDVSPDRTLEPLVASLDPHHDLGDRQDVLKVDQHRRHRLRVRRPRGPGAAASSCRSGADRPAETSAHRRPARAGRRPPDRGRSSPRARAGRRSETGWDLEPRKQDSEMCRGKVCESAYL